MVNITSDEKKKQKRTTIIVISVTIVMNNELFYYVITLMNKLSTTISDKRGLVKFGIKKEYKGCNLNKELEIEDKCHLTNVSRYSSN